LARSIEINGGHVVGKGKAGFPGTKIPPTEVEVVRLKS